MIANKKPISILDPKRLSSKEVIKSSKLILETLFREHKREYIDLFFYEKDIVLKDLDLSQLAKINILRKVGDKYRANVQVFPLSGRFICTDFIISIHKVKNGIFVRGRDDVWGTLAYESPYLAKKNITEEGDLVLDLATGSGIVAIFCAEKAKKVFATDVNPKAISYAKFNAILNNVEEKIEFLQGDLLDPVRGKKFDLIIFNGPTLAVPNVPEKYPIYCFGGPDGLEFTRRFIQEAPKYLTEDGKMQWLDPSLGDSESPETLKLISRKWRGNKFKVIYEQRVDPSDLFKTIKYLDKRMIFEPLGNRPKSPLWIEPLTSKEYTDWLEFLKRHNFTHIYAGMYAVYPGKKFEVVRVKPKEVVFKRMNQLPREWHYLKYESILHQLEICESY